MATQLQDLEVDVVTRGHLEKGLASLESDFAGVFSGDGRALHDGVAGGLPAHASRTSSRSSFIASPVSAFARWVRWRGRSPRTSRRSSSSASRTRVAARWLPACWIATRTAGCTSGRRAPSPRDRINPNVVEAMTELGIDVSKEFPKPMTDEVVQAADAVITMGCGDACPIYPGKRYEDWEVDDPATADLEGVRRIRDDIGERVRRLLRRGRAPARSECVGLTWRAGPRRGLGRLRPGVRRLRRDRRRRDLRRRRSGAVGVALVFGLVDHGHGLCDGHLSGAHINPAVTIAFTLTPPLPARATPVAYVAAQLAGALAARCCCSRSGPTSPPTSARPCRAWRRQRRSSTRSCSRRS